MAYIGRDIQYGVLDKQSFTANSSTTAFTLDSGVKNAKSLLVSIGGIIQEPDVAYTASGTTLTFTTAPATGMTVYAIYLGKTLESGGARDQITFQNETGDGTTTPFTLSAAPVNAQSIMVTLNGVTQVPGTDYTVAGTTITFTTAPVNGMGILVYHLGTAAAMGEVDDASITDAKIVGMNASKLTGTLAANTVPNTSIVTMDAAKLTGTLPSSMEVDTTAIDQTIASLGMHVAVADNKASFNLPGVFIDQFESDTGILTETNVDRNTASEYISSISTSEVVTTPTAQNEWVGELGDCTFTSGSVVFTTSDISMRSNAAISGDFEFTSTASTPGSAQGHFPGVFPVSEVGTFNKDHEAGAMGSMTNSFFGHWGNGRNVSGSASHEGIMKGSTVLQAHDFSHVGTTGNADVFKIKRVGSTFTFFVNGSLVHTQTGATTADMYICLGGGGNGTAKSQYTSMSWTTYTSSVSATGTLISTASTADSATTIASGVMVYENSDGTATLGTDLKAYFSADDGANWTEAASYGSTINFNGASKKLVKLGKTTGLTSGTQMKLKAEWANQVSGTVNTSFSDSYSTGNRGSIITPSTNISVTRAITKIVDGSKANSADGFHFTGSTTLNSSHYIRFQLSVAKCFTGCRIWNDENNDGSPTHGFWKWQASNDATTWTDLGGSFELNNTLISSVPGHADFSGGLSNNTSEYTYYQMVGVSGAADSRSNWMEWEFEAGAGALAGKETRLHGWAINY